MAELRKGVTLLCTSRLLRVTFILFPCCWNETLQCLVSEMFQRTPLSLAAEKGHADVVDLLLQQDRAATTISCVDKMKKTPLHLCVMHANGTATAALLISAGANVNVADVGNKTPLHYAVLSGCLETAELLLSNGALPVSVHMCTQSNCAQMVSLMSQHGGDVDEVDAIDSVLGHTPLLSACSNSKLQHFKELLKCNADVRKGTAGSLTPLHFAAQRGNTAFIDALLFSASGLAVRSQLHDHDAQGFTPFFRAIVADSVDAAARLLEEGAEFWATDVWDRVK